jgi:hypothetical protein
MSTSSPRRDFRIAAAQQARADVLAGRANEGVLTETERVEYDALIRSVDLASILKLKNHRSFNPNRHS